VTAEEAVAGLLGRKVAGVASLGGAYRVRLADGDEVVAKRHTEPSAVAAEVAGLRWLRNGASHAARDTRHPTNPNERTVRAPGGPPISTLRHGADDIGGAGGDWEEVHPARSNERTVRAAGGSQDSTPPEGADSSGASVFPRVPAVLGSDREWLVIEHVAGGRASVATAERFGRELAALHLAGADAFGAAPPGGPTDAWIGLASMRNVTGARWPAWYAEHRVLPYLRAAVDHGTLHDPAPIESLCARIDTLAGPGEPPARLHGDLWSGNVLWGAGRVWLIDPAAHGGHRETDLAMLRLFGCPHLDRIVAAYDEAAPLADGWRERVPLHQLFPLLVHTVLFGGGYGAQAVAAARSLA
jgi:fructosamine-3-kinase